jgi:hypothetical protein
MATRMQQRRGTAAQWISTNSGNGPILNAGEIGYETDTNKFKIGDGTNHWINLDYFVDANSIANPAIGSTITFEGLTADNYELVLDAGDPTEDRTITFPDATGTVALVETLGTSLGGYVETSDIGGISGVAGLDSNKNLLVPGASIIVEGATDNSHETTLTVTDPTEDRTITFPNATGTVALAENVAALSGATFTGAVAGTSLTLSGDLTVNGTTTTVNSTAINVNNQVIFEGATANDFETTLTTIDPTQDRTISLPNATGTIALTADILAHDIDTTMVHGITDTLQLATLTNVATAKSEAQAAAELTASTALSTHSIDTTSVHGIADTSLLVTTTGTQTLSGKTLSASDNTITINAADIVDISVSATELNYVDGVTSSIQTQLNGKQAVVANVSDVEIAYLDGVTSAIQTQLNNKQAVVANVSDTEIGYLDGVTSGIQTQINGKASTSHSHEISDVTNLQTSLDAKAALAGATFAGAVVLAADPSTALGAATKQYVDSLAEGLHVHASVVAATTANVTLSSALENGDTLDGVTLATGNRILVKNQSTASENGIYVVAASGAPSRATDFDAPAEIDGGDFVFVTGGTVNDNTGWVQTNIVGTVGTDAIAFSQFAGAGTVTAGTNISVTGNQVAVINNPTFSGLVTASASGVAFSDGTQTKEGVPSRTPIIQKTAAYTLSSLTERDSLIEVSHTGGSAVLVSIPTDATLNYPIGTSIDVLQTNTGAVTIAAVTPGTTTVNATPGLKLRTRWSSATLFKRAANTWVVYGDLMA